MAVIKSGNSTSQLQVDTASSAARVTLYDGSGNLLPNPLPVTLSGTSTVAQGAAGSTAWLVNGSAVTQPVSGSVTANQGTAGSALWKVDGSGVTQPIAGSVTANIGTSGSLALETGGNLASLNGKVTTTANGVKVDGSAVTQPVSGTVAVSGLSQLKSTQATVTTSAAQLASTPLTGRVSLILTAFQTNTGPVYLGGSSVTTSTGTPIYPGQTFTADLNSAAVLYAIAAASQTVSIFEVAP